MNGSEAKNDNETQVVKRSKDCGLITIDQVGAETKVQLDRIFPKENADYLPLFVSFSHQQIDHVALELAMHRLKESDRLPKVKIQLNDKVEAEIMGMQLRSLPKQDDANKNVATIVLMHKDLGQEVATQFRDGLASNANRVRDQLS